MSKVLELAKIKQQIKEKELLEEADDGIVQDDDMDVPKMKKVRKDHDEKVFGKSKSVEQLDPFFQEMKEDDESKIEKRAVMRDGRVPKMEKNMEKARQDAAHKQAKKEGWIKEQEVKHEEKRLAERAKKPLKIRASAYGASTDQTVVKEKDKQADRVHMFFD